jgi:ubiquinone biosynthesis UbiH/UbiF/VisC/COQ6 family hydroxylase
MNADVIIIGAGPAGLCMAKSLAESGLKVTVIERASTNALASPAFDGREIALTHDSVHHMRELGVWDSIHPENIAPLRDARIFNSHSLTSLNFNHQDTTQNELGFLISNHLIRKAAFDSVKLSPEITLKTEAQITTIQTDPHQARVTLSEGETLHAKLIIAADSRFSESRRTMGIAADMHDFGKAMMVCVMEHCIPHEYTAWEWFDDAQTLALLPMNGMRSSVVITLQPYEINRLMQLGIDDFNHELSSRFKNRLGAMRLTSTRHTYPLVTVYSKRFIAERFALIGDAAVGMHPVTAHGFNFGLKSIQTLSNEIKAALTAGEDIASPALLSRYEKKHRQQTRPLFMATHAIAKLYSSNHLPARVLRTGALRIASRIKPFKRAVAGLLA